MTTTLFSVLAAVVLPVSTVEEVNTAQARKYPGRVVPIERVDVVPEVSGDILEVGFENGRPVSKGDVLYRIDPVKYEAAVKNAEAKVAECRANLAYAGLSAERHQSLIKARAVSQDDLDRALSTKHSAAAALAAAEANLISARDDLAHCRITAPISGKAGTSALTEGNYVQKGDKPLVSIISTSPIRVKFALSNMDYHEVFASDPERIVAEGRVEIRLVASGETCETGRVEYVENAANPLTDTVDVYAVVGNAKGILKSGQSVVAILSSELGVARAAVPPNAVAQDLQGAYVWAVGGDGRASRRSVVRAGIQGGLQLVSSGLKPGERIVADGVHKVREGDEVVAE
jgi:RND family efflux transporter MFP subunit